MLEKWAVNALAEECGMDRRTVKKRLEKAEPCEFTPEGDPLYHLRTFIDALLEHERSDDGPSSLEAERTRLTKAQADTAELNLSTARKEVVPVEIAFQTVSNMLFSVRRVIETSELNNEQKDEIYQQMQGLKPEDFVSEAKFEEEST